MIGPSTTSWLDQLLIGIAAVTAEWARAGVASLIASFGAATEPDFSAVVSAYDRMLALSLLLVGGLIAFALVERILGGGQGAGWAIVPRTVLAISFACLGLAVIQYLAHYAALLATTWAPDLGYVNTKLSVIASVAAQPQTGTAMPMGSVGGLVLTAILTTFLALLVYLELVIRGALLLLLAVFFPLVCVLAIWPRMAGVASSFAEFLVGLLLSKFVVATAVYVGFSLVLPVSQPAGRTWLISGLAVLSIAAFSPLVLVQALRFTHSGAANLARSWTAEAAMVGRVGSLGAPIARVAGGAVSSLRARGSSAGIEKGTKPPPTEDVEKPY